MRLVEQPLKLTTARTLSATVLKRKLWNRKSHKRLSPERRIDARTITNPMDQTNQSQVRLFSLKHCKMLGWGVLSDNLSHNILINSTYYLKHKSDILYTYAKLVRLLSLFLLSLSWNPLKLWLVLPISFVNGDLLLPWWNCHSSLNVILTWSHFVWRDILDIDRLLWRKDCICNMKPSQWYTTLTISSKLLQFWPTSDRF